MGAPVEPRQRIKDGPIAVDCRFPGDLLIPLIDELRQAVVDSLTKLQHVFLAKDMRDDLALARVLGSVSRIEDASTDRHECIVKPDSVTRGAMNRLSGSLARCGDQAIRQPLRATLTRT